MAYWLFKSEPETWSWDDQVRKGIEPWDGVRNYQACAYMKEMQKGDLAFFYHSGKEKRIVGIVEIVKTYYPDSTDESGRFGMVDVKAVGCLQKPVTLDEIKRDSRLSDMRLVRQSRLSVMPIQEVQWRLILEKGSIGENI